MKGLLFILLLCITTPALSQNVIPADWSDILYYNDGYSWGPGGKPKYPVPEPASYGMFMIGASLSYALLLRRKPRK